MADTPHERYRIDTVFSQLTERYSVKQVWTRDLWHLSTGFGANTIRYHDAIIEWATSARYAKGDKHYVITEHGLAVLGDG